MITQRSNSTVAEQDQRSNNSSNLTLWLGGCAHQAFHALALYRLQSVSIDKLYCMAPVYTVAALVETNALLVI